MMPNEDQQILSELNKLTKEKLIYIIMNKKVPEGCNISEVLRNFVENSPDTFHDNDDHQLCNKVGCLNTLADARVTKVELNAAKLLINEKERSVENLTTIINLLKTQANEVKNDRKQTSSSQHKSAATEPTSRGYATIRPSAAVPSTEYRPDSHTSSQQQAQYSRVNSRNTRSNRTRQYSNSSVPDSAMTNLRSKTTAMHDQRSNTSISAEAVKVAIENATNMMQDGDNTPFTKVSYRNKRSKTIIGSNSESVISLKRPLKLAFLHVYKLHPETTVADVKNFLEPIFPEVQVEQLNSRYPDYYSSFKVTINETKLDAAMTPTLWPAGACVNRFFHLRVQKTQST